MGERHNQDRPLNVKQWSINELRLEATGDLEWHTFPLAVRFRHRSAELSLDGYWDGGRRWCVRFALPLP